MEKTYDVCVHYRDFRASSKGADYLQPTSTLGSRTARGLTKKKSQSNLGDPPRDANILSHKQSRLEICLPVEHKIIHASTEAKDRFSLNYESFLLNSKGGSSTQAIDSF